MDKRVLKNTIVNGIMVSVYEENNEYFVEYYRGVNITKKVDISSYYMLDIYRELDPNFAELEIKDINGDEISPKNREIYNTYLNEANAFRFLK